MNKSKLKRYLPISVLLLGLILFFYFRLYEYFTFSALQQHRELLINWTQQYYLLSALSFCLIYIAAVALSFPGATILTLLGGFLFGTIMGSVFVILSATVGACLIFMATKTAFGDVLAKKAGPFIKKFEKGFQEDAFSYLLILRFVPLFPFWLINIIPALLGTKLRTFFLTTLIGIMPGSIIYVSVGSGLGTIFDSQQQPNLSIIFEPEVLLPIIGLALLSFVPVIYKKIRKNTDNS